jgi:hypothetical protein
MLHHPREFSGGRQVHPSAYKPGQPRVQQNLRPSTTAAPRFHHRKRAEKKIGSIPPTCALSRNNVTTESEPCASRQHSRPVSATDPQGPPQSSWAAFLAGPWLLAAGIFALSLVLYTRHNDFPYTYHPDEHGKVTQIIAGSRNYHHPLLMLSATDVVSRVAFIPRKPQPIVETGRWVSAAFAAGAVAALALIARLLYGALAGWGAGVAVALQAELFETAHYMKEDPALMFGIALALLAAHWWWRRPGRGTLRFLAIACGVAAAGKYLGIVALAFAVPMVIWHRGSDTALPRGRRLKLFAIAFVITFLACNLPLFAWKISSPFRSIRNEMEGVAGGHRGITRKVPHGEYVEMLRNDIPRAVLILGGAYALILLATARRRTAAEWATLLFPIGYLAMISCSPKIAERYLLPVSAMLPLLAALGAAEAGRALSSEDSRARAALGAAVTAGLCAWIAAAEWPSFDRALAGFQRDDPKAVADWIRANLPADAVIAEDHRVSLSAEKADGIAANARVPQKVLDANFAADLGTFDELRARGVTHVAVCKQSYGRYFKDETKPREDVKTSFDKRREFYARVLEEGELLKEWKPGAISYLQPGIKFYRIAPPKN